MDRFYNREGFRAEGDPPYVWGFDFMESETAACEALDSAGIGGLYELVGAMLARREAWYAKDIEDAIVGMSTKAFRPLVPHVLDLGVLRKDWADFGEHGFGLTTQMKSIDDPTPFVPWWADAA